MFTVNGTSYFSTTIYTYSHVALWRILLLLHDVQLEDIRVFVGSRVRRKDLGRAPLAAQLGRDSIQLENVSKICTKTFMNMASWNLLKSCSKEIMRSKVWTCLLYKSLVSVFVTFLIQIVLNLVPGERSSPPRRAGPPSPSCTPRRPRAWRLLNSIIWY